MVANNEVGTIANVEEIGKIAHTNDIIFHTDAAQAVGHLPMDVQKMNIDLMSISGHKVYGPKGVGTLYCRGARPRIRPIPLIYGGGHERGIRSGTLNVPCIVGLGKAIEIAGKEMAKEEKRFKKWTRQMFDRFIADLGEENVSLNGHPTERLSHNLNVYFRGIENKALINSIQSKVAISSGAACTTTSVEPSYVIRALGYSEERAYCSVRFGLGRYNTEEEVNFVTDLIIKSVKKLRTITSHTSSSSASLTHSTNVIS
jgi:cysteine desulfurase